MSNARNVTKVVLRLRELPALPAVVRKLLAIMEQDRTSADDINRVIASDHVMAAKVLKVVNSPFYSRSGEVASITQAVVMLGHEALRNLAVGFGMSEAMVEASGPIRLESYWVHAICSAAATEALGTLVGEETEEAFVAGLLHDIGIFVLNIVLPGKYEKVIASNGEPLLKREQAELGMRHNNVGQHLLSHWKLPTRLSDVARFHHSAKIAVTWEEPLVSVAYLADGIVYVRGDKLAEAPVGDEFLDVLANSGIDSASLPAVFDALDRRVEEMRVFLEVAGVDENAIDTTCSRGTPRSCCVLTEDLYRSSWVQASLAYLGHDLVDPNAFLADDHEVPEVDLLLLDPDNLSKERIADISDLIDDLGCTCAIIHGGEDPVALPDGWGGFSRLPCVFSQRELDALQHVPVTS